MRAAKAARFDKMALSAGFGWSGAAPLEGTGGRGFLEDEHESPL